MSGIFIHPKTGNVGIGLTNPRTALEVNGTITASNISVIGDFVRLNTVTSNTEQMVIENAGTGPALKVTQTGANSIAEFYDDGNVLALKIADGGNVGIGVTNPFSKLHLEGNMQATELVIAGTQFVGPTYLGASKPTYSFAGDTNTGMYRPGTDTLGLVTNGIEQVSVLANGNVGIGTTVPQAKLDVIGSIKLSGTLIGNSLPIYIPLIYDSPQVGSGYMPKVPPSQAYVASGILNLTTNTPFTIPASPKQSQRWDGYVQTYCYVAGQLNLTLQIFLNGSTVYKGFSRQWHPTATNQPISTFLTHVTLLPAGDYTFTIYAQRADNGQVAIDTNCCWFVGLQTI